MDSKIKLLNQVSIGCTYVDGRIIFKDHTRKWARFYYGICHYESPFDSISIPSVWCVTPLDFPRPTQIATIMVDPIAKYCEKSKVCLDLRCELNRFDKNNYIAEFSDCGAMTLGLPQEITAEKLWFNEGKWRQIWRKYMIPVTGGVLKYNEENNKC